MAKTEATKRRKSKRLTPEAKEINTSTEEQAERDSADVKAEEEIKAETGVVKEDQVENESTDVKTDEVEQQKADKEEDAETDVVIEVKGSTPTVNVSWDKNEEEENGDANDRMITDDTVMCNEEAKATMPEAESVEESKEKTREEETEETEDKEETEMITAVSEENECLPRTAGEDGESDEKREEESNKEMTVNVKRKAESSVDSSPSKKTKLINDGYCLFVGNLNNSKHYEELKNALANYFMTQNLLFQNIRLDCAKKHAYIDLASEMDLTKALTLDGEMLLEKPMKIAKAKVKTADKVKVKDPQEVKKAKDARCLFVKNIPYTATKEDILKVFPKAIAVRFLGGTESPSKGIAFVEFQNKGFANAAKQQSQGAKIQDRFLTVDTIGGSEDSKSKNDANNNTTDEAPPKNTLFVSNLPFSVQEKNLKKIFQKAVKITIPQNNGKSRGYAFVEFASVADAEKALESSKNSQIFKRPLKVQFCLKSKTEEVKVLSKTLIVLGLKEKTTAETLKGAFEGALNARINVDKDTGVSRKFGFVDFESVESCQLAKESMEDCEIDGCKVTVEFARPKRSRGPDGGQGASRGRGQNFRGGIRGNRGGKGRGARQPLLKKTEEVENTD